MIALYNTEKKELIAIFKTPNLVSCFLYGNNSRSTDNIRNRVRDKVKIHNSRFPFPVALRLATDKQTRLLKDKDGIIFEGYPITKILNVSGTVYKNFENEKPHKSLF